MNPTPLKLDERNKSYQKTWDSEEVKKVRDEYYVELRKKKRIENLVKRSRCSLESNEILQFDPSAIDQKLISAEPRLQSASNYQQVVNLLADIIKNSLDPDSVSSAVEYLRKIASFESTDAVKFIIASGITHRLIELLSLDHSSIQFNISWIIANIAAGTKENCSKVVSEGAVEKLAKVGMNEILSEASVQAIWALSNISGECIEFRNKVYSTGIWDFLIKKLMDNSSIDHNKLSILVWFMSNLLKFKPYPQPIIASDFMRLLPFLMALSSENIIYDTLTSINYLTAQGQFIQEISGLGLFSRIVSLVGHESLLIKQKAVAVIVNLSTGDQILSQSLFDCKVLDHLFEAISVKKREIVIDALFALNNLVMGTPEHIQNIINHQGFGSVYQFITDYDKNIRKEAMLMFKNIFERLQNSASVLVNEALLRNLLEILTFNDPDMINLALDIFYFVFKDARTCKTFHVFEMFNNLEGANYLDRLQGSPNGEIYRKVNMLFSEFICEDISNINCLTGTFTK